jgi:solute carrier family 25, member 38
MRTFLARSPYFVHVRNGGSGKNVSVLPSLTSQGNLLAGATTRVAVGFLLNPFSVLKARFEV